MKPKEFCSLYLEYFGKKAPLPIAIYYSEYPDKESQTIPGCIFKQFHRAYKGEPVSFSEDNLTCGGGKLYLGIGPLPFSLRGGQAVLQQSQHW